MIPNCSSRGENLDEDVINDYFLEHFQGDCLLAVGDENLIKIHFHTNEPWQVLQYCASLGEIFDIVVEDESPGQRFKGLNSYMNKRRALPCGSALLFIHPHTWDLD